jgi:hypothetical protein
MEQVLGTLRQAMRDGCAISFLKLNSWNAVETPNFDSKEI